MRVSVARSRQSGNEKCEAYDLSPESAALSTCSHLGVQTREVDSLHPSHLHR